jgi:hypothetical protein
MSGHRGGRGYSASVLVIFGGASELIFWLPPGQWLQRHDGRDTMESEEAWMELHVLHRHGWSIAALAREFGLDWRTAKRYATVSEPPRHRAGYTAGASAWVARALRCADIVARPARPTIPVKAG